MISISGLLDSVYGFYVSGSSTGGDERKAMGYD